MPRKLLDKLYYLNNVAKYLKVNFNLSFKCLIVIFTKLSHFAIYNCFVAIARLHITLT